MVHPSQQSFGVRRRPPKAFLAITLNGRERTFPVRPWPAAIGAGGLFLFLSVFIGATAYLVYRDDLLGATLARQVRMQHSYEDRLAALRSEIDRVTSRNIVQTHSVAEQLTLLLQRQAELDERQSGLAELLQTARRAGVDLPEQQASESGSRQDRAGTNADRVIQTVTRSLDGVQASQNVALDALAAASNAELERISAALAPVGAEIDRGEEPKPQGGPFIPAAPLHFVERTTMLSNTLDSIAALRRAALDLPLRSPVPGSGISSRFGYRSDPFLNRPALHSGLDFAAAAGAPVRAAGAGTVVSAGWSGGYGKLVEIRHADGVSTRYGHLSAVLVAVGDRVEAGSLIGRVGSTGRSTGPHLHYETRRDGEAVDPALFLAAGRAL